MDKNIVFDKIDNIFEVAGIELAKPGAFKEIAPEQETSKLAKDMASSYKLQTKGKDTAGKFSEQTEQEVGKKVSNDTVRKISQGCPALRDRIKEIKPKYHIFGHIHEHGGNIYQDEYTTYINASISDEFYALNDGSVIFDYN